MEIDPHRHAGDQPVLYRCEGISLPGARRRGRRADHRRAAIDDPDSMDEFVFGIQFAADKAVEGALLSFAVRPEQPHDIIVGAGAQRDIGKNIVALRIGLVTDGDESVVAM